MKLSKYLIPIITITLFLFIGCSNKIKLDSVNSFEDCVKFKGQVMESYPRQCSYKDKYFTEVIEEEIVFRGEITKIIGGVDGSEVTLKNEQNQSITSIISIPNLGPNSDFNFSSIQIGNIIQIKGEGSIQEGIRYIIPNHVLTVYDKKHEKSCVQNNGSYEMMGKIQIYMCDFQTKDYGSSCSDSNQCEGLCLENNGLGYCSKSKINFGCNSILQENKKVTICID